MGRRQNRIQIVNKIITAAQLYQANLVGKSYMYIFDNRYIEVIYRTRDFLHLTGVDTKLSAKDFYKEAVRGTLRDTQIGFSQRHPFDLCVRKSAYLDKIVVLTNADVALLESLSTGSLTYQFAATDLNFTICFDRDTNNQGVVVSNNYIARSLRVEDSFSRSGNAYEVDYIFSKSNQEAKYTLVNYISKGKKLSELPDEIKKKLSPTLFC